MALRGAVGAFEAEFVADFRLPGAGSAVTTYAPPYAASFRCFLIAQIPIIDLPTPQTPLDIP